MDAADCHCPGGMTVLVRVAIFAAVLCALALSVPSLAPRLIASLPSDAAAPDGGYAGSGSAGRQRPADEAPPLTGRQLALRGDSRGHFVAKARVNGRTIDVMIDTGATVVSLSDATARRLGIVPPRAAYTARVVTANGEVAAAPVMLSEVSVGTLSVRDVKAVVVPGDALRVNLLGMSFLGRLSKFEIAGGRLLLTQ